MSFQIPARVKQTSTTTGGGALTLIAAAANLQGFTAVFGASAKVMYAIAGASYWEVGIGTYTSASNQLTRDTIFASSAGGAAVSLPAATHDVFAWWPGGFPSAVIAGTTTLGVADLFQALLYTGGAGSLNLPAVANVPAGIFLPFVNAGSGDWTFDPSGAESINGAGTLTVKVGQGGWLFFHGATQQWRAILGVVANAVALDAAQTWLAAQTISIAGLTPWTMTSTDAGASGGPNLDLFRDSASPAASDALADIQWNGRSSTGVKRTYADIVCLIVDALNTSEDSQLYLRTIIAGVLNNRLVLGAGVFTPNAGGGDPGADNINAKGYLLDGVTLPVTKGFVSANQTITAGGNLTLAHGLGVVPKFVTLELQCTSTDGGYSVGAVIEMKIGQVSTTASNGLGVGVSKDATNLNVAFNGGSGGSNFEYVNTSNTFFALDNTKWVARFRAFA